MEDEKMFEVIEAIEDLIDDCDLTSIELLGIFEVMKDNIHKSCICNDCARKLYGENNEQTTNNG